MVVENDGVDKNSARRHNIQTPKSTNTRSVWKKDTDQKLYISWIFLGLPYTYYARNILFQSKNDGPRVCLSAAVA